MMELWAGLVGGRLREGSCSRQILRSTKSPKVALLDGGIYALLKKIKLLRKIKY